MESRCQFETPFFWQLLIYSQEWRNTSSISTSFFLPCKHIHTYIHTCIHPYICLSLLPWVNHALQLGVLQQESKNSNECRCHEARRPGDYGMVRTVVKSEVQSHAKWANTIQKRQTVLMWISRPRIMKVYFQCKPSLKHFIKIIKMSLKLYR